MYELKKGSEIIQIYKKEEALMFFDEGFVCDEFTKDDILIELIKKQIEQRATEFVKRQLNELDYDNEGEVALYAANENSEWHDEAVKLQGWIEEVYKKMYELQDSITVDNYKEINLNEIEAEYPAFEE